MERLSKTGRVAVKKAADMPRSRLGIGFEKLDRAVFEPSKAYDKIAALGVKWIRLQSGWQRTEREKGVYRFEWLDAIVDNFVSRGCEPWICLCYGNDLYNEEAKTVFGAVGYPPIRGDEQKKGWADYVAALTAHFSGRVGWYEIWNEPDWIWRNEQHEAKPSGAEYGQFVIDTAAAIHKGDINAKIIGGSICQNDMFFIHAAFEAGMGDYIDALTFHEYTPDETTIPVKVNYLSALAHHYNPNIKIIQGESGSQSRSDGCGAMAGGAWTPERQAKQCVRHTVIDLMTEVYFTSFFTSVDMIEALSGDINNKASYLDYGYFGVLGADFDENGFSTGEYTPKPSYYALQTLCSVFGDGFENAVLPVKFISQFSQTLLGGEAPASSIISGGFKKPNGSYALAYWKGTELMTTSYEGTISVHTACLPEKISLVDLINGDIYDIPDRLIGRKDGDCIIMNNLPLKDYPLLLTFGDFVNTSGENKRYQVKAYGDNLFMIKGIKSGAVLQRGENNECKAYLIGKATGTPRTSVGSLTYISEDKWLFGGLKSGGPYTVEISGFGETEKFDNIYVGDLWLLGGQSNMEGAGNMTDEDYNIQKHPDENLRAFYMEDEWRPAQPQLHRLWLSKDAFIADEWKSCRRQSLWRTDDPYYEQFTGVGPGYAFIKKLYELTGVPQGAIPCGIGGSSLDGWNPDEKDKPNYYSAMMRRFAECGGNARGLYWDQGEGECWNGNTVYTGRMEHLIESLRRDTAIAGLPVVINQISRMTLPAAADKDCALAWTNIRELQRRLPEHISNLDTVSTANAELSDLIHKNSPSQHRIGKAAAISMAKLCGMGGEGAIKLRCVRATVNPIKPFWYCLDVYYDNLIGELKADGYPYGFTVAPSDAEPPVYNPYIGIRNVSLHGDFARIELEVGEAAARDMKLWYCLGHNAICTVTDSEGRYLPAMGPVNAADYK